MRKQHSADHFQGDPIISFSAITFFACAKKSQRRNEVVYAIKLTKASSAFIPTSAEGHCQPKGAFGM